MLDSGKRKTAQGLAPSGRFSHFSVRVYSATAAVSTAALSATVVSTTAVSESAVSVGAAVLLPQDAKEIAAIATNIKTNFFIFFAF